MDDLNLFKDTFSPKNSMYHDSLRVVFPNSSNEMVDSDKEESSDLTQIENAIVNIFEKKIVDDKVNETQIEEYLNDPEFYGKKQKNCFL